MYDLKDALEIQVHGFGDRSKGRMYSLAGVWPDPFDDDADTGKFWGGRPAPCREQDEIRPRKPVPA